MQFAVMVWVSQFAKRTSIFGVLDKASPGQLPMISPKGHWEDFRAVEERNYPDAEEAKKAIADKGYYLVGASVTITEAFGPPPN